MTQRPAFTLIELLIVTAVFSLTALMATTVYTNIQTTQRKVESRQRVTADGRYLLEAIARSVRTGRINYAAYPSTGPTTPDFLLSTIDTVNQVTCYQLNGTQIETKQLAAGTTSCAAGGAWSSITPADLRVDEFKVYITPRSDPYRATPVAAANCRVNPATTDLSGNITAGFKAATGACICQAAADCWIDQTCVTPVAGASKVCSNANTQPQVTIFVKTSANAPAGEQRSTTTLQTTVTSRIYLR